MTSGDDRRLTAVQWPDSIAFWREKRVVVTGGSGFLGSFVVAKLRERGAAEVFVPRSGRYDLRNLEAIRALLDDTSRPAPGGRRAAYATQAYTATAYIQTNGWNRDSWTSRQAGKVQVVQRLQAFREAAHENTLGAWARQLRGATCEMAASIVTEPSSCPSPPTTGRAASWLLNRR